MNKKLLVIQILLFFSLTVVSGQVRIRLFADQIATSGVFTVTQGQYAIDVYDGKPVHVSVTNPVILALFNGKVAVKIHNSESFMCDSLVIRGLTGKDSFAFRVNGSNKNRQMYSGDLEGRSDLGILLLINICDIEDYIAGVVRTEIGPGRYLEYLKAQVLLTRTYLYKHYNRHLLDRYNLCDDTHCQAFHGITDDSLINRAAHETKGLVVLDRDSILVISAFHSNCGGETSTSDAVWLSGYPYIRKVSDPYCLNSPNARWRKVIPLSEWEAYLKKSGFNKEQTHVSSYNFSQLTRQNNYRLGSFSIPFSKMRSDLNLRSAFFSVEKEGQTVVLKGRGYGHGVGLCQEGARVMAAKGFKFNEIINFYYTGVIIADISHAKIVENDF
jgi:stage II sporulation protein D